MSKIGNIFGGGNEAEEAAERARAAEAERQARIRQGYADVDTAFAGFDDDYYTDFKQSYLDWALPQLNKQHQGATRNLVLALSPRGMLNSGTQARLSGQLESDVEGKRQEILDRAEDITNKRRAAVEQARSSLYGNVRGSADPAAAAQQAANQAQILTPPPAYQPLGQLLQDFGATVAEIKSHSPVTRSGLGARIYSPSTGGGSSAMVG